MSAGESKDNFSLVLEDPATNIIHNFVYSVSISPDGELVASGHQDRLVRIWNATNGSLLETLEGHTQSLNPISVSFSPDGKRIISAATKICVWDTGTGNLLKTLKEQNSWIVNSICFSNDGKRIVSADEKIRVWDAASGKLLQILEGHTDVRSLSCSSVSGGNLIVSGARDNTVRVWNMDGQEIKKVFHHPRGGSPNVDEIIHVSISPDAKRIISASGSSIHIWSLETLKKIESMKHSGVTSVSFLKMVSLL